jgi:UPF0716 protein FxsA
VVALLAIVVIVIPILEIVVFAKVAGAIGLLATVGLLLAVSAVGAFVVKREGMSVVRRIRDALDRGEIPHREVVDGGLIVAAGLLLLIPGFVTDAIGALLLLPPVRAVAHRILLGRFRRRIEFHRHGVVRDVDGQDMTTRRLNP